MLPLKLWNYIRGYVIIIVEGYFLEKFMNICIRRQIFLWDVKRTKSSVMTLKVSIKGFKMLRPIARKSRCRVRIAGKRGIPFILNRYRGRKAFVGGAVLFIAALYSLTSFVWSIEISGNKDIETQTIVDKLDSLGVKPGTLKYKIDTQILVNDIMLELKELAWVGITVKGTKVKVEVAERIKPPEIVPTDIPCDIYASKDGIIKSIVVKAGLEMVKPGATVKEGQLLVTGTVPNKAEGEPPRKVHALAVIKARTWYEKNVPVSTRVINKERTGAKKDNYSLELFSKRINIFPSRISYGEYDKIEIKKSISLGKDMVLPFALIIDRYYENNLTEMEINIDEAKKIAAEEAYKLASEDIPDTAEVVNSKQEFIEQNDGSLLAVVTIECLEDIGVTKEIGGN